MLEPTDVAGAVKLYGGHARPVGSAFPYCPLLPDAAAGDACDAPEHSLRAASRRRASPGASRRPPRCGTCSSTAAPGACSTYPGDPGPEHIAVRPSAEPRRGVTVAYLPAANRHPDAPRRRPRSIRAAGATACGRSGPSQRYTRAANAFVQIGPRPGAREPARAHGDCCPRAGGRRRPDDARGDGALPASLIADGRRGAGRADRRRVPHGRDHDRSARSSASRRRLRATSPSPTAAV